MTTYYEIETQGRYQWEEIDNSMDPAYTRDGFTTRQDAEEAMAVWQENYPEASYRIVEKEVAN